MAVRVYTYSFAEVCDILREHINLPGTPDVRANFNVETTLAETPNGKFPAVAVVLTSFTVAVEDPKLPANTDDTLRRMAG
jgi:hypothetical protein